MWTTILTCEDTICGQGLGNVYVFLFTGLLFPCRFKGEEGLETRRPGYNVHYNVRQHNRMTEPRHRRYQSHLLVDTNFHASRFVLPISSILLLSRLAPRFDITSQQQCDHCSVLVLSARRNPEVPRS